VLGTVVVRFVVGGALVTLFALVGDVLRPKTFAGLFGAAPSVALATLALTIHKDGAAYAAVEARSMLAGAVALFIFTSWVSRTLAHGRRRVLPTALAGLILWVAIAGGQWALFLR
jgi:hypothetical protein